MEEAEFEERYFKLKVKLKRLLNNLSSQHREACSSANNDTIMHALQQQTELIKQISLQSSNSQANGSSDAIAHLLEQQTQILRGIADASKMNGQESRVKLPIK